jgi:hypothetical protein
MLLQASSRLSKGDYSYILLKKDTHSNCKWLAVSQQGENFSLLSLWRSTLLFIRFVEQAPLLFSMDNNLFPTTGIAASIIVILIVATCVVIFITCILICQSIFFILIAATRMLWIAVFGKHFVGMLEAIYELIF